MDLNTNERSNIPQIVVLEFYEEFEPDPNAGDEGGLKAIEYVKWQKKGVSTPAITIDKITRLQGRPATGKRRARDPSPLWSAVEPFYKAWKAGQEAPEHGTPLAAWPGCPKGLAEALKNFQVRTVEDFIGMPDSQRDRINYPGVRAMVSQARQFMKSKETKDAVQEILQQRTDENEELRLMVAELQGQVEALTAPQASVPVVADDGYKKYDGYDELKAEAQEVLNAAEEDNLRAIIKEKTGKAPHHKLGLGKLRQMAADLKEKAA